jgi:hypothetical protein
MCSHLLYLQQAELGEGCLNLIKMHEIVLTKTHLALVLEYASGAREHHACTCFLPPICCPILLPRCVCVSSLRMSVTVLTGLTCVDVSLFATVAPAAILQCMYTLIELSLTHSQLPAELRLILCATVQLRPSCPRYAQLLLLPPSGVELPVGECLACFELASLQH